MGIDLTPAGGRYPFGQYDTRNIRATLEVQGDQILIRIDDIEHIQRWEELVGDVRTLLAELLRQQSPASGQRETLFDAPAEEP